MVTTALNHKTQSPPEEPSVDPVADDDVGELTVGELVGERLDVLRQQPGGVLNHIVGGGVDAALVHGLRHKEEVVP